MGIYSRYKRSSDGLRRLVELLEGASSSSRKRMIDAGMAEDPEYTQLALKYVMTFEDIIQLPDLELAEVMYKAPPRFIALAMNGLPPEIQSRLMSCCPPKVAGEVREFQKSPCTPLEAGGARVKLIQVARELEKSGHIHTKQIPLT